MYDWEFAERIQCSDSEKLLLLETVFIIVSFADKARREGLLALEDEISEIHLQNKFEEKYFQQGLQLIVDGTDPELVRQILQIKIYAGNYKGSALLSRAIMLDGILSIQSGDNPRIVFEKLLSFFTDEFLEKQSTIDSIQKLKTKYKQNSEE